MACNSIRTANIHIPHFTFVTKNEAIIIYCLKILKFIALVVFNLN